MVEITVPFAESKQRVVIKYQNSSHEWDGETSNKPENYYKHYLSPVINGSNK